MKKMILALFSAFVVNAAAFDVVVESVSFAPSSGEAMYYEITK